MTRKKVKLEWIENNSARRASFRKRRAGLMKKVSELSTLCGVDASIVIYSPDETVPTVWPSHAVVQEQFTKFKSMPESERVKKMSNHEAYLKDKVSKLLEQLSRTQRRNMESEMNDLMLQIHQGKEIHELNLSELNGLTWFFTEKMKDISRRMESHRQLPYARGTPPPPQTHAAADKTARLGEIGSVGLGGDHGRNPMDTESLLLHQWFIETMKNKALKGADSNKALKGADSNNTRSDKGYPYHPFSGATIADDNLGLPKHSYGGRSSSVAASDIELGLGLGLGLSPGNFTTPPLDMGLPSFRTHSRAANNMGLQPHGGSNFGPFGTDIGLGLGLEQGLKRFNGHIGSSSAGSELGLAPLGLSGSSNGSGIDAEVPSDGKTKPKNSA